MITVCPPVGRDQLASSAVLIRLDGEYFITLGNPDGSYVRRRLTESLMKKLRREANALLD